jgi:hypothetical protein
MPLISSNRIVSPQNATYDSGQIEISIQYSEVDLSTIWFGIQDHTRAGWALENVVYLRRPSPNALTFGPIEEGTRHVQLDDGSYTLHVWANSTGWGDENLLQPKVVNTASASVEFTVRAGKAPTATPAVLPQAPSHTIPLVGLGVVLALVLAVIAARRKTRSTSEH